MTSVSHRCPVGPGCTISLPSGPLLEHLRKDHRNHVYTPTQLSELLRIGASQCDRCRAIYKTNGLAQHKKGKACTIYTANPSGASRPAPGNPAPRGPSPPSPVPAAPRPIPVDGPWRPPTANAIGAHGKLIDTIAPELLHQWLGAFQEVTGPYMTARSTRAKAAAIVNLLLLPGAALRRKRGGKTGLRALRINIAAFVRTCPPAGPNMAQLQHRAALAALPRRMPYTAPTVTVDAAQEAHNISTAEALLGRGLMSRATHALGRSPLANTADPSVLARLHELHPQSTEYQSLPPVPPEAPRIRLSDRDEDLRDAIRRWLSNGSTAGPSGLTGAHVLPLLDNKACYSALLAILTDIINAEVDPEIAPLLLSSRLVPSSKPTGGVRPIAVGEVLMRLAGLIAISKVQQAVTAIFGNIQLGCGAPGGSQAASTVAHTALSAQLAVLTIDITNAFNTRSRKVILKELYSHSTLSPIYRIAHLALCHATPLLLVQSSETMSSTHGVRQGCTLAGLLFALSIHRHLTAVPTDTIVCAIQDDITLCGPPNTVTRAAERLKASLTEHSDLHLNPTKEEVLWAGQHDLPAPLREYAIKHRCRLVLTSKTNDEVAAIANHMPNPAAVTNETTLLGVPIGYRAAERAVTRMTRNTALFTALNHPLLSHQNALLLLRLVCNSFGTYLARTMHPDDSRAAMEHLDALVLTTLRRRLELSDAELMQPAIPAQIRLKLAHGGMGFYHAEPTRFVAFWAAIAQAAPLLAEDALQPAIDNATWLRTGLAACWTSAPFATLRSTDAVSILPPTANIQDVVTFYRSQARPQRQRRHRPGQNLDSADAAAMDQERMPAERLQRAMSTKLAAHQFHDFLTGPISTETYMRLQSLTGPGAVLWLTTCPTEPIRRFQNLEFSSLVRLRLGLTPLPAAPERCICPDSTLLAAAPSHTLSCQHLRAAATESTLIKRHDLVKLHLASLLRQAGLQVSVEPQDLDERLRTRPDLSVHDRRGRTFLMDTTVINPTAASAGANVFGTEETYANEKRDMYKNMAAAQNATFIPLVFNLYGHWHECVDHLLAFNDHEHDTPHAAFSDVMQNTQLSMPLWRTHAATVLSCAVQQGNANVMQMAAQHLRSATRAAQRGLAPSIPLCVPSSLARVVPDILSG
jgi:hypothetical protein